MTTTREQLTLDSFPRITQQETMTSIEFTAAYGQFVSDYYEKVLATPASDEKARLQRIVAGKIYFDGRQTVATLDEYRSGLNAIGAASTLLLHLDARTNHQPVITPDILAKFVEKYGWDRVFVRLDQHGNKYAIVA